MKFKGLVAAAFTPMHEDGSIAPERVEKFVEYSVDKGFTGLFAVGSTGEFSALTMAERKTVAEAYIKSASGRIPVIVNVASCSIGDARELAAHSAALGADALCVMAPFYFRPGSPRALADSVKPVAEVCGGRPLFLYHAPGMTGVQLPMDEFLKIMADEVPNFAGLKFTSEDLCLYRRCIAVSEQFQILYGRDEMLLGALAMGAEAGVGTTYNYLPRIYHGIYDSFQRGDLAEARRFTDLGHLALKIAARYPGTFNTFMKFAGVDPGPRRPPIPRYTPEQELQFRQELSDAGLDPYIG